MQSDGEALTEACKRVCDIRHGLRCWARLDPRGNHNHKANSIVVVAIAWPWEYCRAGRDPLFTELELLTGSSTGSAVAADQDKEIERRQEERRRASALRAQKRKEISARRPKPQFLGYLKRRLGEEVDPANWTPHWRGFLAGESDAWWKAVSEDTPHLRFITYHADMVVGCPTKDNRVPFCQ
ncbi:hypothetical protein AXG93_154s1650 [Marchantia polymorpha subsp. ruderalis]|uniref:Uncharacterized protein n=1 Tax=Marchantia polymorpha subsp. ruderalis TaxID=1480154 RepID=A0A176VK49_MARPO|nr:hypothetical protein AXG93_154s1650 [Marchantia polymorpha subsp. ruderalis]